VDADDNEDGDSSIVRGAIVDVNDAALQASIVASLTEQSGIQDVLQTQNSELLRRLEATTLDYQVGAIITCSLVSIILSFYFSFKHSP
jgi:hypothetical protein